MNPTTTRTATRPARRRRLLAVGVIAASLSVAGAGAGAAMAVAPTSSLSTVVAGALNDVGVDWSMMPDGYTQAQYEAFWGAGYSSADVDTLSNLWSTDMTETKSRAGQLLLEGGTLPITPTPETYSAEAPDLSTLPYTQEQADALWGAGYTGEDVEALGALWETEFTETKARAGQLLLDGQTLEIAPGSTPVTVTGS